MVSRISAFNLISLGGRPTLLGTARQNGTCSPETGCDGNTLYGDNRVLSADLDNMDMDWTQVILVNIDNNVFIIYHSDW